MTEYAIFSPDTGTWAPLVHYGDVVIALQFNYVCSLGTKSRAEFDSLCVSQKRKDFLVMPRSLL